VSKKEERKVKKRVEKSYERRVERLVCLRAQVLKVSSVA
jgi:hypothetical protein